MAKATAGVEQLVPAHRRVGKVVKVELERREEHVGLSGNRQLSGGVFIEQEVRGVIASCGATDAGHQSLHHGHHRAATTEELKGRVEVAVIALKKTNS